MIDPSIRWCPFSRPTGQPVNQLSTVRSSPANLLGRWLSITPISALAADAAWLSCSKHKALAFRLLGAPERRFSIAAAADRSISEISLYLARGSIIGDAVCIVIRFIVIRTKWSRKYYVIAFDGSRSSHFIGHDSILTNLEAGAATCLDDDRPSAAAI